MIFLGTPNMLVKEHKRVRGEIKIKPIFRFNENGEFETEDPKLIEKLSRKFTTKQENSSYSCKKCDFVTDNKGLLMSHYKTHKEATA